MHVASLADYKPIPKGRRAPFMDRVCRDENGCWLWMGYIDSAGYGMTAGSGFAHRRSYELNVGPIPDGLVLDRCVNPEHLEAVTQAENVRRSTSLTNINTAKTHCVRGHSLEGAYLQARAGGRTYRRCRACSLEQTRSPEWKAWRRAYLARKREEKKDAHS